MTNNFFSADIYGELRAGLRAQKPLIHCITNPISINDCANIILAAGGKPVMAEHPLEAADITVSSAALAVNLGNITDVRLTSMMLSGKAARQRQIPCSIDLVGTGCSALRRQFARSFIEECRPAVIKGNISEIKALCAVKNDAAGIDAGQGDLQSIEHPETIDLLEQFAKETTSIVLATGQTDVITDGENTFLGKNGTPLLGQITGTGCMLNALTALWLSGTNPLTAALAALSHINIAGERAAEKSCGPGTFHMSLLDTVWSLNETDISQRLQLSRRS